MGKPSIPDGVTVRHSILRPVYRVSTLGFETVVRGISTAIIASRFRAGEGAIFLAADYRVMLQDIDAALRWELHARRWRVERVREAVKGGKVTHG